MASFPPNVAPGPAATSARDRQVRWLAWIAAAFGVAVALVMGVNHFQVASQDPLKSKHLAAEKEALRAQPTDEGLKEEIRRLDLSLRQRFFRHLSLNAAGGWCLLGAAALFLLAARHLAARRKTVYAPPPHQGEIPSRLPEFRRYRRAVGATGLGAVALLLILASAGRTLVPTSQDELARLLSGDAGGASDYGPTEAEMQSNWPGFRGPFGDGVAVETNVPSTWDAATGEGILWKSAVPLPGFNSPVVWGDRVFLSGGSATNRSVFCYEARRGQLLWQSPVPSLTPPPGKPLEIQEHTGVAAPTVATDGRRVYAIFATGELVAFDFNGRVVWAKHLGVPQNPYGHSTSLLIDQGRLLVQFDQGEAEQQKSRLYALDPATGRIRWEQPRPVPSSWTTPLVLSVADRRQIITMGEPWVIAYEPADGRELWRAECLGADLAPSPAVGGGLLFVVNPSLAVVAIRPDGQGEVTQTHIAWKNEDGAPDIASPVSSGPYVFLAATSGTVTCLDAKTGIRAGERSYDLEFNASPTLIGDRLLLVSISGVGLFLKAAPGLDELSRGTLGEKVYASPAVVHRRIYLRGEQHLYALGSAGADGAELTYGK
jgi:outer membrane protein assembly factor BamB